ncbi:MAG: toll/interleukin-1 receptor domain-containing protein, partial [Anaerolineales bacterium]
MSAGTFISYSRKNLDEVITLAGELKARGLRLWQDISDLAPGRPTEEQIRAALAEECGSFLVYLTPESLQSKYVMRVELQAALDKWRQDRQFTIIPVFRGLTIPQAGAATRSQTGRDITIFHGVMIPANISGDSEEFRTSLGNAARQALAGSLERRAPIFKADPSRRPVLDLHTRQYTARPTEADLDLDWRSFFKGRIAPSALDCSATLLPALESIRETIASTWGLRSVSVRAKAHISAGIALGFAFRAPTGFHLTVEQNGDVWGTEVIPASDNPLTVMETGGSIEAEDLAVQLSVAHDISRDVDRFVQARGEPFRARVTLQPHVGYGRKSVANAQQALSMAIQAAEVIRHIRDERRALRTHLFAAVPIGLAVLLGYQLNACGPIQLYEYDKVRLTF